MKDKFENIARRKAGACVLIVAACFAIPSAHAQIASVKTVFVIVMSSQPWSRIKGSSSAPYINGVLLPMGAFANNYFTPPGNALVEANYLWLEAGSNFGITTDALPSVNHQSTTNHFVTLLSNAGITWKTYQEGIDGIECPTKSSGLYDVRYNPFVFFDDVTNNLSSSSPLCLAHVRPYVELASDLNSNNVAQYNFIKPSGCDAMNASCTSDADHVKQGDSWLAQEVPRILASAAYKSGGALFLIWDHSNDGSDGPVGMILLSPFAKNGYANLVRYSHGSTLRTFQEIFNVKPFLGDAAGQTPLDDLFSLPAVGNAGIALTWGGSPGATSYNVKRATSPNGPFSTVATGVAVTSYTDRGLTNGTTYFYIVSAVNGSGESPASAQISATPLFVPPAPTDLTVKQVP